MRTALLTLSLLLTASGCPAAPVPKPTPTKTCHEDESCWNCRTMGNRRCGPTDRKPIPTKPRRTAVQA
jgi:hypothetical protein